MKTSRDSAQVCDDGESGRDGDRAEADAVRPGGEADAEAVADDRAARPGERRLGHAAEVSGRRTRTGRGWWWKSCSRT